MWGQGEYGKSLPFIQFYYESKTTLKKSSKKIFLTSLLNIFCEYFSMMQ